MKIREKLREIREKFTRVACEKVQVCTFDNVKFVKILKKFEFTRVARENREILFCDGEKFEFARLTT